MQEFSGKTVVVTGAAGNLGRATALAFARRGARLALIDLNADALQSAQNDLPAGCESAIFATDVLDGPAVAAMIAGVTDRFGAVHVLANIAGGFAMGPTIEETTDAQWDSLMDLNLRSVFNCCRAAIPRIPDGSDGRIVNISARAAVRGAGHMGPYCVSKAAVITLTESLAEELKQRGITVNCVLPGTLDTPQNRAAMPDADHDTWVPLDALADVILFLASDAARCVTGAAVPVYGRS
ncbi:SDR family oxidoreductase [Thiocapsa rosea]|uniref:NAD(P)-dependent dehydrogenase (Short-subunit alcohol dehydrogenase family) n=1 Tax=Thiocapsa rosea TaxID=69360 RepID=A0A495V1U9_9GAMM|nr:SDR family NAD(P)-dependent oxidoreductase [Thiocapsa rosea]RKT43304.1 NAD(P)-dependent dehydrogenase (short-subunit alcohol dehydrogenase family) [Thiocapsa rosea]